MTPKSPSTATLHRRILGDIEKQIISGDWPPGFRLPFEVDLAKSYGVSRMTVNKVLSQLASAGLIERRKRSGSVVAQPRTQSAILEIHDIESEVIALKREYSFTLVSSRKRRNDKTEIETLGLGKTGSVNEIVCVHHAGDIAFCLEERIINLDVVPAASVVDFSATPPGKWLQLQVPWITAEHRIYAIAADDDHAVQLKIAKGAPCLVVQRKTWSDQGPVTFVRFTYPAEHHAIIAKFTPATTV